MELIFLFSVFFFQVVAAVNLYKPPQIQVVWIALEILYQFNAMS